MAPSTVPATAGPTISATSQPTETGTTELSPTSTGAIEGPAIDPQLAERIPDVEGYTAVAGSPPAWMWDFYDIPDGLRVNPALISTAEGDEIGRLIVADSDDGTAPIDRYTAAAFAGETNFVSGATYDEATEQTIVASNSDIPGWANLDGGAVITASVPDQNAYQWAWSADGLLWIVRGTAAAEGYVRDLLARQLPSIEPFDQQGMLGDLYDRTPTISGYTYLDLPREAVLASLPNLTIPDCFAHVYLGYIRPTGQPVTPLQPDDLAIAIFDLADACVDLGYADHVRDALDTQGWRPADIAGIPVVRDANNIAVFDDDTLIHLRSDNPSTLDDFAPVIQQILAGQP